MKKFFSMAALASVAISAAFLSSCTKEADTGLTPSVEAGKQFVTYKTDAEFCGQVTSVRFLAGQHINVGTIEVANDADSVYVTYNTTGPWRMRQLHLFVGKCNKLPTNKSGNPVPGQFPYKKGFGSYSATTYTFSFAKSSLDSCFCVAAHAEVAHANGSNSETGWGEGTRFVQKGNWGMFFSACKQACIPPDPCLPKADEGCSYTPNAIIDPSSPSFFNGTVLIGGITYTNSEAGSLYQQAVTSSDAYNGFILLAAIQASNSIAADAGIKCQITVVDNWLATLGRLDVERINFQAPQDVKDAIAAIEQWLAAHNCQ